MQLRNRILVRIAMRIIGRPQNSIRADQPCDRRDSLLIDVGRHPALPAEQLARLVLHSGREAEHLVLAIRALHPRGQPSASDFEHYVFKLRKALKHSTLHYAVESQLRIVGYLHEEEPDRIFLG